MSGEYQNYFVDVDGRTYRVALHRSGHPLIVVRRGYDNRDTGRPLLIDGKIARAAIKAALKVRAS